MVISYIYICVSFIVLTPLSVLQTSTYFLYIREFNTILRANSSAQALILSYSPVFSYIVHFQVIHSKSSRVKLVFIFSKLVTFHMVADHMVVGAFAYHLRMVAFHSYLEQAFEAVVQDMQAVRIQRRAVGCGASEVVVVVEWALVVEPVVQEPYGARGDGEPLSYG
ncbi:hypothetical protein [Salmonella sp. s51933]|uniref:hypothetical protein n=1 Tax=unclassified Salmonella TaxID=2614656 RepID=UPI003754DA85